MARLIKADMVRCWSNLRAATATVAVAAAAVAAAAPATLTLRSLPAKFASSVILTTTAAKMLGSALVLVTRLGLPPLPSRWTLPLHPSVPGQVAYCQSGGAAAQPPADTRLAGWAVTSEWAHDTGGDPEDRPGPGPSRSYLAGYDSV